MPVLVSLLMLAVALLVVRPSEWQFSVVLACLCLLFAARFARQSLRWLLALVVCFAAWVMLADRAGNSTGLLSQLHGVSVMTEIRVLQPPKANADGIGFIALLRDPTLPRRVAVFWPQPPPTVLVRRGDCWRIRIELKRLSGTRNPGVFDYVTWQREQGISARASVRRSAANQRCHGASVSVLQRLRNRVGASLAAAPVKDAHAAILRALLLGDRSQFDESLRLLFAATGTSHLMAISGLHVGLVAALGVWLGRRQPWPRTWPGTDRGIVCGAMLACGYVALSGFAITAQRALLALAITAILVLARRRIHALRLVAMAAITLLMVNPARVVDGAFVFSFAAVGALALLQANLRVRSRQHRRGLFALTLQSQCLMSIGLAPLVMAWFGYFSFAALPANLIVVPVFSLLLVPLVLIGALAALLGIPLTAQLWWLADQLLAFIIGILNRIAGVQGLLHDIAGLPHLLAALLIALAIHMVLSARMPGRYLPLPALISALLLRNDPPRYACVDITMLDVGHGTAMAFATARDWFVYDTGPAWRSGSDAGARILVPYLNARGADEVALAVLSHADMDHVGGARSLAAGIDVTRWLGARANAPSCRAGQRWHSGGISWQVIWPVQALPAATRSDNDASCVVRISVNGTSVLLAGDIERAAERELIAMRQLGAQLLVVPHHGSATSSTASFVEAVGAQVGWISAAQDGRWALPHADVRSRWLASGAQLQSTATSGALQTLLCGPRDVLR